MILENVRPHSVVDDKAQGWHEMTDLDLDPGEIEDLEAAMPENCRVRCDVGNDIARDRSCAVASRAWSYMA